jgi:ABC-type antimicrobial peptide transport system permease subunit
VSLLGGAAGILLGVVASAAVSRILQWPSLISPAAIVLAAMFSFGVGIVFGYYPARIASRLDPIEAIRYE